MAAINNRPDNLPRLAIFDTVYANGLYGLVENADAEARTIKALPIARPTMAVQLQAKRVGGLPQEIVLDPPCLPAEGGLELSFILDWAHARGPLEDL